MGLPTGAMSMGPTDIDLSTLPAFLPLANGRRRYAWGSLALPRLLGETSAEEPVAEVWVGAHPSLPSIVELPGGPWRLDEAVAASPAAFLGPLRAVGRLPFLLKLLAADSPLSIQLHPDAEQAQLGFNAENEAGIALEAADRVFVDPWAKPELLVAIEPFDALCGLRSPSDAAELLDFIASTGAFGFSAWAGLVERGGYDGYIRVIAEVVALSPERVARALSAVSSALRESDRWTAEHVLFEHLLSLFPRDAGALVALFLRPVHLEPGEALVLRAGTLHAYLRGLGVELMSTSDNVIRAGLTSKHCDAPRLVQLLRADALPEVLRPALNPLRTYDFASSGFALHDVCVDGSSAVQPLEVPLPGPGLAFCLSGSVQMQVGSEQTELRHPDSVYIRPTARILRVYGQGRVIVATSSVSG